MSWLGLLPGHDRRIDILSYIRVGEPVRCAARTIHSTWPTNGPEIHPMKKSPWYAQYSVLGSRVAHLKGQFHVRCTTLGVSLDLVYPDIWENIVIRAVHESNWQEGVYLERGKTRELALHVFEDLAGIVGPHLDLSRILDSHRRSVVALKRKNASVEHIAAYNLSAAHWALRRIGSELAKRQAASLAYALREAQHLFREGATPLPPNRNHADALQRGFEIVDSLLSCNAEIDGPITDGVRTEGQLLEHLLHLDFADLLHPMRIDYIHFLHQLVMMGIADPRGCGKFRRIPVHVGNPDLLIPPPSLVPPLMAEFCKQFPTILPETVKYDPIMVAARVSHRFVRIHPYRDGNGRVSRLLMNLVLWCHHPPVYLKADKKGRHRYEQALKRADRGNLEPLACLIAMSLIEIYQMMIHAVASDPAKDPRRG